MRPAGRSVALIGFLAALSLAGEPAWCAEEPDRNGREGDAAVQLELGLKYFSGEGVPRDYARAANCFRKAAELGEAIAQCNLGVMYYEGLGVERDYALSHMWLSLAEERGDAVSAEYREIVAGKMTPYEIMESRKLVRTWKLKQP